jgi:hypothetical protein
MILTRNAATSEDLDTMKPLMHPLGPDMTDSLAVHLFKVEGRCYLDVLGPWNTT